MKRVVCLFVVLFFGGFLSSCRQKTHPELVPSITPLIVVDKEAECSGEACVPLPTGEDIVRLFFNLINEGRASEAVEMLSTNAAPTDNERQIWGVNFNSIKNLKIKEISVWDEKNWKKDWQIFKVVVDVQTKSGGPSYGWEQGENTKWIPIVKNEEGLWKIEAIASGP